MGLIRKIQNVKIQIGNIVTDGLLEIIEQAYEDTLHDLNAELAKLRNFSITIETPGYGEYVPSGPVVESSVAPVIDDPTRLIEPPE